MQSPTDLVVEAVEIWKDVSDRAQLSEDPNTVPEDLISLYKEASSCIETIKHFQDECKGRLQDWMVEMEQTQYKGQSGQAGISAPSIYHTYDKKALDVLFESDDNIRRALLPHRKRVERAGSLYIR